MDWYTYDFEVTEYDWIGCFKNKHTGEWHDFHNDRYGLKAFMTDDAIYCGFNTKHYDWYIVKGIVGGLDNQELKYLSDYIVVQHKQGWECPMLKGCWFNFNNVDLTDDMQMGTSLKSFEGHYGLDIKESDVDFNIGRPLTADELKRMLSYCHKDVDATEILTDLRKDYLRTKINIGRRANISDARALASTNAKLTATLLGAVRRNWNDGRDYVYPENLDLTVIPKPILDFFDKIHDKSIPDDVLFATSLDITIGGMPCKFGWGGVHGSLIAYHESATEDRVIQNDDVSSLYPSLIEEYGYLSRNVSDPQVFYSIRRERIEAKRVHDKQTANDLKLPLNTVSGAQENQYNDLYDPLPTRSIRISGQLFLTVLVMRLLNACKTIKLLNLNTDGVMYSIDKVELPIAQEIIKVWQKETRLETETDSIQSVWIKDVNNYIEQATDGSLKLKGGYLVRGISTAGAFKINNNATIVADAIVNYFVKGIEPEQTINECNDILQFQLIAKAGSKYKESYHEIDGQKVSVQKVNRVYATKDEKYGKLHKIKATDSSDSKIASLPEHCIVDNDNRFSIEDIDKQWYIDLARQRINEFQGIKPKKNKKEKKTMAEKKAANTLGKLLEARVIFQKSNVTKSGKNSSLEFKYFELDDIVPTITKAFKEVGLVGVTNFNKEDAILNIYDTENPEGYPITFSVPFTKVGIIENRSGKACTNELQALGSSITYLRRYLYMMALDICEPDMTEATLTKEEPKKAEVPTTYKAPEVVKADAPKSEAPTDKLTSADGQADEVQISALKTALVKLKQKDPTTEDMINQIIIKTEKFTKISKRDCEALVTEINKKLA